MFEERIMGERRGGDGRKTELEKLKVGGSLDGKTRAEGRTTRRRKQEETAILIGSKL